VKIHSDASAEAVLENRVIDLPRVGGRCKIVDGFEDYAICENGTLWSRRGKKYWCQVLGSQKNTGHVRVAIYNGSGRTNTYLHRIVLEAFVGPCPDGMEACHSPDYTPTNNQLSNLRWGTPKENGNDAVLHGRTVRGSSVCGSKLTPEQAEEVYQMGIKGVSQRKIALLFKISQPAVKEILRGRNWRYMQRQHEYVPVDTKKKSCDPCEVCGTDGGPMLKSGTVPARVSLSSFGVSAVACMRCYLRYYSKRKKATRTHRGAVVLDS